MLEIWVKTLVKKISKNVSSKYAFKTASQKVIQKAVEATEDLIGNKIADQITRVSKANEEKKKPLEKNVYVQKRDRKLLMIYN